MDRRCPVRVMAHAGAGALMVAVLPVAGPGAVTDAFGATAGLITIGDTRRLEIPAGDHTTTSLNLDLRPAAPGWVTIDARSLDCDLGLDVGTLHPDGSVTPLAEDDDGGDGGNSRLSLEAAAGAAYRLGLRCRDHDEGGPVEVAIASGRADPPAPEAGHRADISYFEAVLARGEERGVPRQQLRGLRNLAVLARNAGDYTQAGGFLDRAQPLYEQLYGAESQEALDNLSNRGVLRMEAGDFPGARELLAEALAIFTRTKGPESDDVGTCLNNLGAVEEAMGDVESARRHYEGSLAVREKVHGRESIEVAQALANLGVLTRNLGLYDEALPYLERALALDERLLGPDDSEVATQCSNLAATVQPLGDYARAQRLYERAIAIDEKNLGSDHPDLAHDLNNLATLYSDLGLQTEARALIERGLGIRERRLGPDHPAVALSLNALGLSYKETGEFAAARQAYERALRIFERALGPEHARVGMTVQNLGALDLAAGNAAAALPQFERAIAVFTQTSPAHPALPGALDNLALALMTLGRSAEALPAFDRDVALRQQTLGPQHPLMALSLANRAECRARLGAWNEALAEALQAETIARAHSRLTARALPEDRALSYDATRPRGLHVALSVTLAAPGGSRVDTAAVWDALIRSRAVVLDEMAARHRHATSSGDPTVAALAADLASATRRLANLTVRGPSGQTPERNRQGIEAARQARLRAESALAAASPAFRAERAGEEIGFAAVAASLPPGAGLVAFVLYGRQDFKGRDKVPTYAAFVLPAGGGTPAVVSIGAAAEIDPLVTRWQEEAVRGANAVGSAAPALEARYRLAATALRRAVWEPIAARLGPARLAFIVPDGALNLVNLATLPAEDGRYLLESGPTMHILSAERDLGLAPAEPPAAGAGLLALGGPAFDAAERAAAPPATRSAFRGTTARCGEFGALRFTPLPETVREAKEISRLWIASATPATAARATTLTGPAATEAALKAGAPGRRLLHLATHGFFLGGSCSAAAPSTRAVAGLISAPAPAAPRPPGAEGTLAPRDAPENPLRLSGLALAGANRRDRLGPDDEDGILTAEEVAALDLSGVEWAVLSACETGIGEVQSGEGVLGLRRAFQVAGAATLITSLWSVDDEATRAFMTTLYQARLERRLSTAEALRDAGRRVLADRRRRKESPHPFFWGAFVAAGAWR